MNINLKQRAFPTIPNNKYELIPKLVNFNITVDITTSRSDISLISCFGNTFLQDSIELKSLSIVLFYSFQGVQVYKYQILAYSCEPVLTKTFSSKIWAEFASALLARIQGIPVIWAHCRKIAHCLISITDIHEID